MGISELFMKMPPSSLKIYKILQSQRQMTFKEITSQTDYSTRTVRYALRDLSDAGLIGKIPDITDLRRCYYSINR
ncbi:MAG: winged helix-turn-helix domain-containing protein [Candidatus Thorarchaeota archaeon]